MNKQQIVFGDIWQQMKDAVVLPEEMPTVLGGRFEADDPTAFLHKWLQSDLKTPWRIWEHVSFIEFADMPREPKYLQRAELFGEGGHLSLRRDGNRWRWHFIGPAAGTPLPADVHGYPWALDGNSQLRCYPEKAILWGKEIIRQQDGEKKGIGVWWEDRVGAANLKYPEHLSGIFRVYLHFDRYTQAGRTVFVRYRGLGDGKGVKAWRKK